jgi:hypothetical protein
MLLEVVASMALSLMRQQSRKRNKLTGSILKKQIFTAFKELCVSENRQSSYARRNANMKRRNQLFLYFKTKRQRLKYEYRAQILRVLINCLMISRSVVPFDLKGLSMPKSLHSIEASGLGSSSSVPILPGMNDNYCLSDLLFFPESP